MIINLCVFVFLFFAIKAVVKMLINPAPVETVNREVKYKYQYTYEQRAKQKKKYIPNLVLLQRKRAEDDFDKAA